MRHLGATLAAAIVIGALQLRLTDPLVPLIARDLGINPEKVALISTGFAFAFGIMQLVFGPLGDMLGKVRVIRASMVIVTLGALLSALAFDYWSLLAGRFICGVASAGVMPVSVALVGDRVVLDERQAALSRLLGYLIFGGLAGAVIAGLLAEVVGWRGVFALTSVASFLACVALLVLLPAEETADRPAPNFASAFIGFRDILANRRAPVCYAAVFTEGLLIFGLFPFVALLLERRGEGGAAIAGIVVACFSVGGLLYSLIAPQLIGLLGPFRLMPLGGALIGMALLSLASQLPWQGEAALFAAMGLGFYMLHSCLQLQVSELLPARRGSAVALHGFSFSIGQALGPIYYGAALAGLGTATTFPISGLAIGVLGVVGMFLLRR